MCKNEALISKTETQLVYSECVQDEFKITVAFPRDYSEKKVYPVVYLLDSNIFLGLFVDTVRLLNYGKEIPDVIVVGIGYANDKDHLHLRNRDFGPTPYHYPEIAGGASEFLSFINNELKPIIQSQYPINNDSTLVGDSMSGLFALYTLFHQPESFNRYIIGSPSMYWDDSITFKYEETYFSEQTTLKANVFMSSGALEAVYEPAFAKMVDNVVDLSSILRRRNYTGLNLTTHIFDNETHLSVIPATFSRGLREVFCSLNKE